jgi:hypothetical protein
LVIREAENCYILGDLPRLIWEYDNARLPCPRFFALKDRDQTVAAAVVQDQGGLLMTWASQDMVSVLATQLRGLGVKLESVFAPGYVSWQFADTWSRLTGQQWSAGREERIYQLSHVLHEPASTGQLAPATVADDSYVKPWLEGFARETQYQSRVSLDEIRQTLYTESRLFIWRNPDPVAMAAWVAPTPNGGSINIVFVPSALRGHGHGKNVIAALARKVLAGGARYCFILTDTQDRRTNHLYPSIGARTVAEVLQCTFQSAASAGGNVGGINFVTRGAS